MTTQWKSCAMVCVASVEAHTEDSPMTEPTDRSMPPPVMTKVIPMLITPTIEASRRMVSRLSMLANRSPAVMTPKMHSASKAITRPRFRPVAPLSTPPRFVSALATRSTRADSSAAGTVRSCSLTRHFLP